MTKWEVVLTREGGCEFVLKSINNKLHLSIDRDSDAYGSRAGQGRALALKGNTIFRPANGS